MPPTTTLPPAATTTAPTVVSTAAAPIHLNAIENGTTLLITEIGDITSSWSAPSSCYYTAKASQEPPAFNAPYPTNYIPYFWQYDYFAGDDPACNPPTYGAVSATTESPYPGGYANYYAPATCPDGWYTAAVIYGNNFEQWVALAGPTNTPYACCPIGYTWDANPTFSAPTGVASAIGAPACTTTVPSGQALANILYFENGNIFSTAVSSTLEPMTLTRDQLFLAGPINILTSAILLTVVLHPASSASTGATLGVSISSSSNPTSYIPPPTSTPQPSTGGLSPGDKAGIAVGIIVFFLALFLGVFVYFRKRKRDKSNTSDPVLRPNTHELITDSNRHELITKANAHEMEQEKQGAMAAPKEKPEQLASESLLAHDIPRGELDSSLALTSSLSELDTRDPASRLSGPVDEPSPSPQPPSIPLPQSPEIAPDTQLEEEAQDKLGMLQERMKSLKAQKRATQEAVGSAEEDEKKLGLLQDRIERIRAEKERLERIQRLEELEEETKREILEASRRISARGEGSSIPGSNGLGF